MTATWTGEGQAAMFVAVSRRSAECVGIRAAARARRFETPEPIRQGGASSFRWAARDSACGLAVRRDHAKHKLIAFPRGCNTIWLIERSGSRRPEPLPPATKGA